MKTYVNFSRFQYLLYYYACFIGLAPFSVKNKILHPVGFLRKAYAVILAILNLLWMYFVSLELPAKGIKITLLNQLTFIMIITLLMGNLSATLLIFAFKSDKVIEIWNQITAIKEELKKLGIEDSRRKNCKTFYAKIIATNTVFLFLRIIIDNVEHDDHNDRGTAFITLFWFVIVSVNIHSHNTNLIFIETMICIRALFESLNNKLQGTVRSNCNFLSSDVRQNSSVSRMTRNRHITDQVAYQVTSESENIQLTVEDVGNIGKLHRELHDLVNSITEFHTVLILFTIVRHFTNLLFNCYSVYIHLLILHDHFETTEAVHRFVQRRVAGTAIPLLELFLIAHSCTSMSRTANATKVVLHGVWNKFYPEELGDEFSKLSLQLLHNPVTVSAFGFFDLGYSCIFKIFCAIVAYLIVMIQFDKSQPNSGT